VGRKLQLLGLLTFLEEERRLEALGDLSSCSMKGKREVKNLESLVNYDARGSCLSHGKRKWEGTSSFVMKPRILSWNVRGLNKRSKRPRVSNLLRDWKVDIICFQETKIQSLSRNVLRSLWGCNHVDWCSMDSNGALEGILIMWDTRVVEKVDECVGDFTLVVSFRNFADHFVWTFAGIYGPNS